MDRILDLIDGRGITDIFLWHANAIRFLTWQNFMILPLFLGAVWAGRNREMPEYLRLMMWSIVLILFVHVVLMPYQGHGWGFRYFHPVLGNIVLVATFGFLFMYRSVEGLARDRFFGLVGVSFALSLLVLPIRFGQTQAFVKSYADANIFLQTLQTDLVMLDTHGMLAGGDFVRNNPMLTNVPLIVDIRMLNQEQLARLCTLYGRIRFVSNKDLEVFGLLTHQADPVDMPAGCHQRQRSAS